MLAARVQEALLTSDAVQVLGKGRALKLLWLMCLESDRDGVVRMSLAELGTRLGFPQRNSVYNAVRELRDAGVVREYGERAGPTQPYQVVLPPG